uniref:CD99 antigen n=1 Tax=Eptatretus burgeri TaxID=7764 RepID=A0A8C4WXT5_EPTBU
MRSTECRSRFFFHCETNLRSILPLEYRYPNFTIDKPLQNQDFYEFLAVLPSQMGCSPLSNQEASGRGINPSDLTSEGESDENSQATPGTVAGILAALIGGLFAGASSFVAYQKKKLCFKQHGKQEGGGEQQQGDEPQIFSSLLKNTGRFFNLNTQQQQPAAPQYAEPSGKADRPGEYELPDEQKVHHHQRGGE